MNEFEKMPAVSRHEISWPLSKPEPYAGMKVKWVWFDEAVSVENLLKDTKRDLLRETEEIRDALCADPLYGMF